MGGKAKSLEEAKNPKVEREEKGYQKGREGEGEGEGGEVQ